jgi:hypothetical protein
MKAMSNVSECLTFPALVRCLEGAYEGHVDSCARCNGAVNLMSNLIREETTPEEEFILNEVETFPMPLNIVFRFHEFR